MAVTAVGGARRLAEVGGWQRTVGGGRWAVAVTEDSGRWQRTEDDGVAGIGGGRWAVDIAVAEGS